LPKGVEKSFMIIIRADRESLVKWNRKGGAASNPGTDKAPGPLPGRQTKNQETAAVHKTEKPSNIKRKNQKGQRRQKRQSTKKNPPSRREKRRGGYSFPRKETGSASKGERERPDDNEGGGLIPPV